MAKAQSMRRGGIWLLIGEATDKGCTMLRLMLLTMVIPKDEVGLASVFILILSFFDLVTDLGAHNLLLQADDADDPRLLNSVHGVMALRGAGLAAIMFFAAPLLARMFYPPGEQGAMLGGEDKLAEGLRYFAIVPLLRGFCHYDNNLSLRRQNYRPVVFIAIIPALTMVAAAYPLARFFQNYYAMLALIVVQEAAKTLVSHLAAMGRWRWLFSRPFLDRILAYGGPLMINGLLMYLYSLGDRTLISSSGRIFGPWFGHEGYPPGTWADYMVAVSLAAAPVTILARLVARVALPLMAKIQRDTDRLAFRYRSSLVIAAVGGGILTLGLTLLGGTVALIFGKDYGVAGRFMGPIALMQALALLKVVPTSALLARGDTRGTMVMTLWRTGAILPMAVVAAFCWDIWWMAVCGAVGELVALVVVYRRLCRIDAQFRYNQWKSLVFVTVTGVMAMAYESFMPRDAHLDRLLATAALCAAALLFAHLLFPLMTDQLIRLARGRLASDRPEAEDAVPAPEPGEMTRAFDRELIENLEEQSFGGPPPAATPDDLESGKKNRDA